MLILRSAAALLLGTAACSATSAGDYAAPPAVSPSPSIPADAHVYDGANVTIPVPGRKLPGKLYVDVESHRSPAGTTVTLRAIREEDCHIDKAAGPALYVCTEKWSRRKTLPASAFTFDGLLGTATLTTTVDGKPLMVTWTGEGASRDQVNQNGALLLRMRDASSVATWGRVRHNRPVSADAPSLLYHRVTATA